MHPRLQSIAEGNVVRTSDEWETAVRDFILVMRIPSKKMLFLSKEKATKFVRDAVSFSVFDIWLSSAGEELGLDFASIPLWAEATEKLKDLQRRANDACMNFELQEFPLQLQSALEKLGIADPE